MRAWPLIALLAVLVGCPTTPDDDDSVAPDDDDTVTADDDDSVEDDDDDGPDDDDVAPDDDDSAPDDDDVAPDDDDSAGPIGFVVTYSFTSMMIEQGTCAEAGQDTIWIEVAAGDGDPSMQIEHDCDDQPIQVDTSDPGLRTVTATTQPGDPDVYFEAEVDAMAGPGLTPVSLELQCYDPGVDDGCGGA